MFKYGSIRNFIVKFLVGIVLFGFGLIYFTSLYSYSVNDPGFNQLNYNVNDSNIENLMGFFGAYLSSYSLLTYICNMYGQIIIRQLYYCFP